MAGSEKVIYQMKRETIINMLEKGIRIDGRKFDDYRNISIKKGVIPNAEGSALVKIGQTQVLAGIKFGVMEPFPDTPKEGVLIVNAEFLPLASETFEPGPPDPSSIELARVVDRGIRESKCIDMESLFIEEGKVLSIFIDLYLIDHFGNYFDASSLAAVSALLDTRMPKVEEGKIIPGEYSGMLDLKQVPVTTTFFKIGKYIVLDAVLDEENASNARYTIGTVENYLCSMQKGLSGTFKKDEILMLVDKAFEKGKILRRLALQE